MRLKRLQPSKGLIAPDFPYVEIARQYQEAGADAVSVLTEPEFFLGADRYLEEIHGEIDLPLLRKDFTVDEYQIYEAKVLGASAVLLICSLLDMEQLKRYMGICGRLALAPWWKPIRTGKWLWQQRQGPISLESITAIWARLR